MQPGAMNAAATKPSSAARAPWRCTRAVPRIFQWTIELLVLICREGRSSWALHRHLRP